MSKSHKWGIVHLKKSAGRVINIAAESWGKGNHRRWC